MKTIKCFILMGLKLKYQKYQQLLEYMILIAIQFFVSSCIQIYSSVIKSELFAIRKAIEIIEKCCNKAVLFTDSRSALMMIASTTNAYNNIIILIRKQLIELSNQREVKLQCVKAHSVTYFEMNWQTKQQTRGI